MTDQDGILARLERLEAENAELRARLDGLTGGGGTGVAAAAADTTPVAAVGPVVGQTTGATGMGAAPVSRRDLLLRTGAGVAAAGVAAVGASVASLAQAAPVLALGGDDGKPILVGGGYPDARSITTLSSNDGGVPETLLVGGALTALYAVGGLQGVVGDATADGGGSGRGVGVQGKSTSGVGVQGRSTSGVGIDGASESSVGVAGVALALSGPTVGVSGESVSSAGIGVRGHAANDALGVYGYSGGDAPPAGPVKTGILGRADQDASAVGVRGSSTTGRGGVFAGKAAQVRLAPSSAATHPASGQAGDLFVDKSNRLWLCKGGTRWKLLG